MEINKSDSLPIFKEEVQYSDKLVTEKGLNISLSRKCIKSVESCLIALTKFLKECSYGNPLLYSSVVN